MLQQVYIILIFVEGIRCEVKVKLPRYVIEPGVKPAIFGSYSYNLLKGDFESYTNSSVSVTEAMNITSSTLSNDNTFRKHASVTASLNQFNWWTRSKLPQNFTKRFKNIFKQTIKKYSIILLSVFFFSIVIYLIGSYI